MASIPSSRASSQHLVSEPPSVALEERMTRLEETLRTFMATTTMKMHVLSAQIAQASGVVGGFRSHVDTNVFPSAVEAPKAPQDTRTTCSIECLKDLEPLPADVVACTDGGVANTGDSHRAHADAVQDVVKVVCSDSPIKAFVEGTCSRSSAYQVFDGMCLERGSPYCDVSVNFSWDGHGIPFRAMEQAMVLGLVDRPPPEPPPQVLQPVEVPNSKQGLPQLLKRNLMKNLKHHNDEDSWKDLAVKNQKAHWDKILELRFLLQKVLPASNKLPRETVEFRFCSYPQEIRGMYFSGGKEVHNAILCSILGLRTSLSSYEDKVLAERNKLLQFAQCEISWLKRNADITKSTNIDLRTPDQLKMMAFGGNNGAPVVFKQQGWTVGGKVEAKYTSRASELCRQLLAKEIVNSSVVEANGLLSSPVFVSHPLTPSNGTSDIDLAGNENEKWESEVTYSPKANTNSPKVPSYSTIVSFIKKSACTKKPGVQTRELGVQKLTTKPNESLYNHKSENLQLDLSSLASSATKRGMSFPSGLEYVENVPSADSRIGQAQVISHVTAPKSSNFFQGYGMDTGVQRKQRSRSSMLQIQENNEARQKFSYAAQLSLLKFAGSISISSANFFGREENDSQLDVNAKVGEGQWDVVLLNELPLKALPCLCYTVAEKLKVLPFPACSNNAHNIPNLPPSSTMTAPLFQELTPVLVYKTPSPEYTPPLSSPSAPLVPSPPTKALILPTSALPLLTHAPLPTSEVLKDPASVIDIMKIQYAAAHQMEEAAEAIEVDKAPCRTQLQRNISTKPTKLARKL